MKKYILTIFSILIIAAAVIAGAHNTDDKSTADAFQPASAQEEDSLIPAVEFEGKNFYLEHSGGDAREWLTQYFLPGEDLKSYTEKISIRTYDGVSTTSRKVASSVISRFTKNNKGVPYDLLQGNRNGEWEVSYTETKPTYAEFNLFRIVQNGKHPVVFQYTRRVNLSSEKDARQQALEALEKEVEDNVGGWLDSLRVLRVPHFFRTNKK